MTTSDTRTHGRSDTRELPLSPDGEVSVTLAAGDLHVRGTDDSVVRVRDRSGDPLDEALSIHAEGSTVVIATREESLRLGPLSIGVSRGRAVDLDIELPRAARLRVRTTSGDVRALDLEGPTQWATVSGTLELSLGATSVAFQTVSGDARVDARGPIAIDGRTVSGDVRIAGPSLTGLRMESTSGDIAIDADLDPRGTFDVATVSGDVQIATDAPVRLETRTVAGDVHASVGHRTEGSRGRRTIVVGSGSVAVAIRTMSGDIRLGRGHHTGPAQPPHPATPPTPPAPPSPPVAEGDAAAASAGRTDADVSWTPAPYLGDATTDRREQARLEILRALERGDVDIDTASRRLEVLEDAGPRAFRGLV